ncbi:NAD-binding protein, partial [Ectopseudomonas khazarica]|uniref:NAD-binding protein n=1 Tax=Ectopseudomonas khazarica TaxID=2502979 RepID=UPI003B966E48
MQIGVIGAGYVGLVTATCFAEMGNRVICVERDPQRVAMLSRGEVPIYEPGLEAMLKAQLASGQLSFTSQLRAGIRRAGGGVLSRGAPTGGGWGAGPAPGGG